ncbi:hypothetical protein Droror1_Dr00024463 [Drosera rotundifolia]
MKQDFNPILQSTTPQPKLHSERQPNSTVRQHPQPPQYINSSKLHEWTPVAATSTRPSDQFKSQPTQNRTLGENEGEIEPAILEEESRRVWWWLRIAVAGGRWAMELCDGGDGCWQSQGFKLTTAAGAWVGGGGAGSGWHGGGVLERRELGEARCFGRERVELQSGS